jgi:hypothetical protein
MLTRAKFIWGYAYNFLFFFWAAKTIKYIYKYGIITKWERVQVVLNPHLDESTWGTQPNKKCTHPKRALRHKNTPKATTTKIEARSLSYKQTDPQKTTPYLKRHSNGYFSHSYDRWTTPTFLAKNHFRDRYLIASTISVTCNLTPSKISEFLANHMLHKTVCQIKLMPLVRTLHLKGKPNEWKERDKFVEKNKCE